MSAPQTTRPARPAGLLGEDIDPLGEQPPPARETAGGPAGAHGGAGSGSGALSMATDSTGSQSGSATCKVLNKCSSSCKWYYIPYLNIFVDMLSRSHPPSEEDFSSSLNTVALIAALYETMLVASTQSYTIEDFENAF